jgi:hypothetical protein
MRLFVWKGPTPWIYVAMAETVEQARDVLRSHWADGPAYRRDDHADLLATIAGPPGGEYGGPVGFVFGE